jgi:hypothetical protein
LKDQNLVRTRSDNIDEKKFRVEYSRATNLLEVRDTAAQFLFGLTKNEYNFDDSNTLSSIFSLIIIIVSNPDIFSVRLCHHSLIVTKELCFVLFSFTQQYELEMAEKSIKNRMTHSSVNLSDDNQTLPQHFENAFAWKGTYVPIKEDNSANRQSTISENSFEYNLLDDFNLTMEDLFDFDPSWLEFDFEPLAIHDLHPFTSDISWFDYPEQVSNSELFYLNFTFELARVFIYFRKILQYPLWRFLFIKVLITTTTMHANKNKGKWKPNQLDWVISIHYQNDQKSTNSNIDMVQKLKSIDNQC